MSRKIKNPFGINVTNNDFTNEIIDLNSSQPFNIQQQPSQQQQPVNQQPIKKSPFAQWNDDANEMTGNINLSENNFNQQQQQNQVFNDLNEPPLLEDLGIDLENIQQKTLSVLLFRKCDDKFLVEADMSGPLLLAFCFGALLMLSGKIHFGYIYGFGVIGTISVYTIMNLLSQDKTIKLYNTVSILGYCILPIVILAGLNIFFNLKDGIGLIPSFLAVIWSTYSCTQFFEETLKLDDRKWLVAYPTFLFYSTFVLLTIF